MALLEALSPGARVAVAMSGGVDSAVAAALLVERGCRVEGWTMRLWRDASAAESALPDGPASARQVCAQLGIPHRVVDLGGVFRDWVVAPFLRDYAAGRTPNPCLRCNQTLKFGALLDLVLAAGCGHLATGHYARADVADGRHRLMMAADARKDQSYFLYALQQEQLAATLFPVGGWTKDRVREYAASLELDVADRAESQDVCFLSGGDYRSLLSRELPQSIRPGPIYDTAGRLLGQHHGLPLYTVGQREGLGVSAARPLYVLRLDVEANALIVGHGDEAGHHVFTMEDTSWVSGEAPSGDVEVQVRVRHRAALVPARVEALQTTTARVELDAPRRDIAPGQAAVFYAGQQVLGGGIIREVLRDRAED